MIAKGQMRFGEQVENAFGEGLATHWFHLMCAAEKRPEKLAAALATYTDEVPERASLESVIRSGIDNPKLTTVRRAERASSGRARCQHCHELIEKGALRVAVEREEESAMAALSYVHAKCAPEYLGCAGLLDKLKRTSPDLSEQDLSELSALAGT